MSAAVRRRACGPRGSVAPARRRRAAAAPGPALGRRPRTTLDATDLDGAAQRLDHLAAAQRRRRADVADACSRPRPRAGRARRPGRAPVRRGYRAALAGAVVAAQVRTTPTAGERVAGSRSAPQDPGAGLRLDLPRARPARRAHRARSTLTNHGTTTVRRRVVAGPAAAAAHGALEVLDLTGRWCRERSPQRRLLGHGTHQRSSRRGRTGHDATLVLMAGTPGFGFRTGEVWGVHVAWSGDHEHLVERLPEGAGMHAGVLGGGELLRPGEVRLEPGETLPDAVRPVRLVRRGHGRARRPGAPAPAGAAGPPAQPATAGPQHLGGRVLRPRPRPDEGAGRRGRLGWASSGSCIDDGWFRQRRDDTAGLGDWYVRPGRLAATACTRSSTTSAASGMQVGLWVEPEMVNLDSDLVRAHPDWLLDVVDPAAGGQRPRRRHGGASTSSTWPTRRPRRTCWTGSTRWSSEYALDYLKWDHNRDLHAAQHRRDGRRVPGVHAQTLAAVRRARRAAPAPSGPGDRVVRKRRRPGRPRHPGAHRPGLGLRHQRRGRAPADPAVDRATCCRPSWSGRTSARPAHTRPAARWTCRSGWPPRCSGTPASSGTSPRCSPEELARVRDWAALYRRLRPLLHGGTVVRADADRRGQPCCTAWSRRTGARRSTASPGWPRPRRPCPAGCRCPGSSRDHAISWGFVRRSARPVRTCPAGAGARPPRLTGAPVEVAGAVLSHAGVVMPLLDPGQALVLHLTTA